MSRHRASKQDILHSMLRCFNYNDAQETLNGPADIRGDGTGVSLMGASWTAEYREIEWWLDHSDNPCSLKREDQPTFAHLWERYVARSSYNEIVRTVTVNDRGNIIIPNHTEVLTVQNVRRHTATARLHRWHPWVRKERVNAGLDYLAHNLRVEPYLPAEFRTAIAA